MAVLSTHPPPAVARRSVLIAEDDLALQRALGRHLRGQGYDVVGVTDAAALESTLAGGEPFDLLLLDLRLGEQDGLSVAERVPPDFPTVLMSGELSPSDVARARGLGVDYILDKPLSLGELDEALEDTLVRADSVRCSFHGLGLVDILQALHLARRTVGLEVSGAPVGTIAMMDGELVDAQCGEWLGDEALAILLQRKNATVRTFELRAQIEPSFGPLPFEMIVLDALRCLDEENAGDWDESSDLSEMDLWGQDPGDEPFDAEMADHASAEHDLALAERVVARCPPGLSLARAEAGGLRWHGEDASAEIDGFAQRALSCLHLGRMAEHRIWLGMINEADGRRMGLGLVGDAAWVCAGEVAGAAAKERFFAGMVRMARSASEEAQAHALLAEAPEAPPVGAGLDDLRLEDLGLEDDVSFDDRLSALCRDVVTRHPAFTACKLVSQREGALRRGRHGGERGAEAFDDPRWKSAVCGLSLAQSF
ncbi:MAG: response regulator, partial [Myxococcales bacterium]|nr:response regulator [Myxococcales bacterium]